jgi:hypothetical protein
LGDRFCPSRLLQGWNRYRVLENDDGGEGGDCGDGNERPQPTEPTGPFHFRQPRWNLCRNFLFKDHSAGR